MNSYLNTISLPPHAFQKAILQWHKLYGRHHLPWQQAPTPYKVWLSEIMLQQTQVSTVIPYFEKFIARFATLSALASADEQEVMSYWSGLGYYARARNLHLAAQQIMRDHKGIFPDKFEDILALPGVGRSTAGAICAFCFQQPYPILDGNVKRVFCRYFGIHGWAGEKRNLEMLWQLAHQYTPQQAVGLYTQAMMDMGATLCIRHRPNCSKCPLSKSCYAYLHQQTHCLPAPKPKKTRPVKEAWFLFFKWSQEIALEKRRPSGIWRALLAPLWFESKEGLLSWLKTVGLTHEYQLFSQETHGFTHFQLNFTPVVVELTSPLDRQNTSLSTLNWHPLKKVDTLPLPAPIKKWLKTNL